MIHLSTISINYQYIGAVSEIHLKSTPKGVAHKGWSLIDSSELNLDSTLPVLQEQNLIFFVTRYSTHSILPSLAQRYILLSMTWREIKGIISLATMAHTARSVTDGHRRSYDLVIQRPAKGYLGSPQHFPSHSSTLNTCRPCILASLPLAYSHTLPTA